MSKAFKCLAIAAALVWAGSAQAAVTFDIGPGWGAEVSFGHGGPIFTWTDQSLDGYPGDYTIAGYYTVYVPKSNDPRCVSDPSCYIYWPISLDGRSYTAGLTPTGRRSLAGSYDSGPGVIWFSATDGPAVTITLTNFVGSVSRISLPEPSTWAMMLVGFGTVGAAMRRRARPAQTLF